LRILSLGALAPFVFAATLVAQTAHPATAPQTPGSTAQAGAPPAPLHPITTVQVHELMHLTGTDMLKDRLVDNILSYFQRVFPPFIPQDVRDDLKSSLNKMDVDTSTVAVYKRYLSTEDATKIIAFYSTPAGKALLKVDPLILGDIQHAALEQGQATVKEVIERHKAEIQAAQKTYEDQHKSAAPSLGPPVAPTPTPQPKH
jgi:hypothetical protein